MDARHHHLPGGGGVILDFEYGGVEWGDGCRRGVWGSDFISSSWVWGTVLTVGGLLAILASNFVISSWKRF